MANQDIDVNAIVNLIVALALGLKPVVDDLVNKLHDAGVDVTADLRDLIIKAVAARAEADRAAAGLDPQ